MPGPEYVRIKISDIPDKFFTEYNLGGRDREGWIYFEIWKGCYGLPQAGILANDLLRSRLLTERFYEAAYTPGLWCHKWRPLQFCLIVNNFGIEYVGIEHFNFLLNLLKKYHGVQCNMAGDKLAGIAIRWDYPRKRCRLSMPGYINNLLSSILALASHNSLPANACPSPMVPRHNSLKKVIQLSSLMILASTASTKLLALSSTTPVQLTTNYL
jgi:hypothetical protein